MEISSQGTAVLLNATANSASRLPPRAVNAAPLVPNEPIGGVVQAFQNNVAEVKLATTTITIRIADGQLVPGQNVTIRFDEKGQGKIDLGQGKTARAVLLNQGIAVPSNAPAATASVEKQPVSYTPTTATQRPPTFSAPVVRFEVLAQVDADVYEVQAEGQRLVASSDEPLLPGQKYLLNVKVTPNGVNLSSLAPGQELLPQGAKAILRESSASAKIGELVQQMAELVSPRASPGTTSSASVEIQRALNQLAPNSQGPPTADQLANLVKNGGLYYEAKLARAVESTPMANLTEMVQNDAKGSLLAAIQATTATSNEPVLQSALQNIEMQQAINLMQPNADSVRVQIPFYDQDRLTTIDLQIQPDDAAGRDPEGRPRAHELKLTGDFSEFGQTTIEAQLFGPYLRTILYIERAEARSQLVAEIEQLRTDLQQNGFDQVLIDVRSLDEMPRDLRRSALGAANAHPGNARLVDVVV